MAEVIGTVASALTIASLLKACLEAFELFRASQRQETELRKLSLRLNIEKCRLYTWGEAMGLTNPGLTNKPYPLEASPYRDLVKESLDIIFQLFHDSQKIKSKYGCREADLEQLLISDREESSTLKHLAASFGNFKVRGIARDKAEKVVQKTYRVIHDREKFHLLIQEVQDLINGVQDITKGLSSIESQALMIKSHVMRISDEETLDMVSDVCEIDHPSIAEAASVRADTISMATTHRLDISDWTTAIATEQSDDISELDVESLTITELKYVVLSGIQRKKRDLEMTTAQTEDHAQISSHLPAVESEDPSSTALSYSSQVLEPGPDKIELFKTMDAEMKSAFADEDFIDELSAIEQWFNVLSSRERLATQHKLLHSSKLNNRERHFLLNELSQVLTSTGRFPDLAVETNPGRLGNAMRELNKG
jgi:Prion-inhibition and propagation